MSSTKVQMKKPITASLPTACLSLPPYPFKHCHSPAKISNTERSPFAKLKFDDLHYTFAEHLSLLEIVSTAEASFHFDRYAQTFIFPRFTTLDLSSRDDFPANELQIVDFRRILNRIGPYVRTVVLGQQLPKVVSMQNMFLQSVLVACPQLSEVRLEEFNVRCSNFRKILGAFDCSLLTKIHMINCRGNALNEVNCLKFSNLRSLELSGIRMQCDRMLVLFDNLETLVISNTFVSKSCLVEVLQRNARSLRRLSLSRLLGFHWRAEVGIWRALPRLVPNVTDLSLCQSKLVMIESPELIESVEVDQPLGEELVSVLQRFSHLRILTVNYTTKDSLDHTLFGKYFKSLHSLVDIFELHLVMENELIPNGRKMCSEIPSDGEDHIHVYVYSQLTRSSRRWLTNGIKTFCQWRRRPHGTGSCDKYHLVDRMRTPLQCDCHED